MLRSLFLAIGAAIVMAFSARAQSPAPAPNPSQPTSQSQDSNAPTEAKKPKKVFTNEDLSKSSGAISVVGDPKDNAKNKPKPSAPRSADAQYVASIRKQLEKLQKQISDIDKQLADLKSFSEGESTNNASGIQLNKSLQREPIEVRMRALQDQKRDLQEKMDALLDEARKKGVEPGDLR
jgi:chaperonin cofactor prefoldin